MTMTQINCAKANHSGASTWQPERCMEQLAKE